MRKDLFEKIKLPFIFLILLSFLYLLWQIFDLPEREEVTRLARIYFDRYGLSVVFLSAIIESVLLVGLYYPGGLVILLSVIFAGPDALRVVGITIVVTLGMLVSYVLNFYIGKYGWYKLLLFLGLDKEIENSKVRLEKHGAKVILLSYWHPNFGSLTATAAGILHYNFKKFLTLSVIATTLWNILWGTIAYFFGDVALPIIGPQLLFAVLIIWIIFKIFTPVINKV